MKKVLFISTIIGFLSSFEMSDMELMEKLGYEVHFACNGKFFGSAEKRDKLLSKFPNFHHICFSRNPLNFINIKAYHCLVKLLKKEHFDVVHCHTPVGGVLGRIAAKKCRVSTIIYTAHGFHFYKGAPLINRLFYYSIEKKLSKITDILITINKEDYELASKEFYSKRIERIHGVGLNIHSFKTPNISREKKREALGLKPSDKVLLTVGELSKDKNHFASLKAMKVLGNKGFKLLIAGKGKLEKNITSYIKKNKLDPFVKLLGYRKDVSELLYASDAFLFPSFFEGISVALTEAIAEQKPIICSRVRGNVDLVETCESFFNPDSTGSLIAAVETIFSLSEEKRNEMVSKNYDNLQQYDINNVKAEMNKIYSLISN